MINPIRGQRLQLVLSAVSGSRRTVDEANESFRYSERSGLMVSERLASLGRPKCVGTRREIGPNS